MPTPQPEPVAEEIDEAAARRSTRVAVIVMSAVGLLSAVAGFLFFRIFGEGDHSRTGVQDRAPTWVVVLILAIFAVIVALTVWVVRRQYRRPDYRRVMQYGWRRRRRVVKDLRRGRSLSAEDMLIAAALVDLVRSQRRWVLIVFSAQPIILLFNGLVQHGILRLIDFVLCSCWLVYLPVLLRQRRQLIRNYERQQGRAVGEYDVAPPPHQLIENAPGAEKK